MLVCVVGDGDLEDPDRSGGRRQDQDNQYIGERPDEQANGTALTTILTTTEISSTGLLDTPNRNKHHGPTSCYPSPVQIHSPYPRPPALQTPKATTPFCAPTSTPKRHPSISPHASSVSHTSVTPNRQKPPLQRHTCILPSFRRGEREMKG